MRKGFGRMVLYDSYFTYSFGSICKVPEFDFLTETDRYFQGILLFSMFIKLERVVRKAKEESKRKISFEVLKPFTV